MRPLRTRLEETRAELGIGWETLERDYVLSWVLAGMNRVDALREALVFKGGTALKKCYFGRYRFSEDLAAVAGTAGGGPAAVRCGYRRTVRIRDK